MTHNALQRTDYTAFAKFQRTAWPWAWLEDDQTSYHDARAQIHNEYFHGWGIASGLNVELLNGAKPTQWTLIVHEGVAIDKLGQLIIIIGDRKEYLPKGGGGQQDPLPLKNAKEFVTLRYDCQKNQTDNKIKDRMLSRFEPTLQVLAENGLSEADVIVGVVNWDAQGSPSLSAEDGTEQCRKLIGMAAGEIRLRRAVLGADGKTISDSDVVTIRPTAAGKGVAIGGDLHVDGGVIQMGAAGKPVATIGPNPDGNALKVTADIQTERKIDGRRVSDDGKKLDTHCAESTRNPHGVKLNELKESPLSVSTAKIVEFKDTLEIKTGSAKVTMTGPLTIDASGATPALTVTGNAIIAGNLNIIPPACAPLQVTPSAIGAGDKFEPDKNGIYVYNPRPTPNTTHAVVCVRVNGTQAGNPFVSYDVVKEFGWSTGVDNGDHQKFKISSDWSSLAATRMTITRDGNVGIGTNSPQTKLDVNGTVKAKELILTDAIRLGNWQIKVENEVLTFYADGDKNAVAGFYKNGRCWHRSVDCAGDAFFSGRIFHFVPQPKDNSPPVWATLAQATSHNITERKSALTEYWWTPRPPNR